MILLVKGFFSLFYFNTDLGACTHKHTQRSPIGSFKIRDQRGLYKLEIRDVYTN